MKGKVIKFNLVGGILVLILIIALIIGLIVGIPKLFKNKDENDNKDENNNVEVGKSYESNDGYEFENKLINETDNSFRKGKEVFENVNFNMYYNPEKFTLERNTDSVSIITYNKNKSTAIMIEVRMGNYEEDMDKLTEIGQREISELIIDNTSVLKEIVNVNNKIQYKYYIPKDDEKYLIAILECDLEQKEKILSEMEKMIESIDIL